MNILTVALFSLIICVTAKKVTYDNYKVFKINPSTDDQVQLLTDLRKYGGYEFWTDVINVGGDVRVMVRPDDVSEFIQYGASVGLKFDEAISDVQK